MLGWKLDIQKEAREVSGLKEKLHAAAGSLAQILPNISEHQAVVLANNGLNSIETFHDVDAEDLIEMGFSPAEAAQIIETVRSYGA